MGNGLYGVTVPSVFVVPPGSATWLICNRAPAGAERRIPGCDGRPGSASSCCRESLPLLLPVRTCHQSTGTSQAGSATPISIARTTLQLHATAAWRSRTVHVPGRLPTESPGLPGSPGSPSPPRESRWFARRACTNRRPAGKTITQRLCSRQLDAPSSTTRTSSTFSTTMGPHRPLGFSSARAVHCLSADSSHDGPPSPHPWDRQAARHHS